MHICKVFTNQGAEYVEAIIIILCVELGMKTLNTNLDTLKWRWLSMLHAFQQ